MPQRLNEWNLRNVGKNYPHSTEVLTVQAICVLSFVQTVHPFYCLTTAELPGNLVVGRALSGNLLHHRVKDADCIIWDEISMSSKTVCEIVNQIHCRLAPPNSILPPFGGKQAIMVGKFLQLRPVPNFIDEGKFFFESAVFSHAFPHRAQSHLAAKWWRTPIQGLPKGSQNGRVLPSIYWLLEKPIQKPGARTGRGCGSHLIQGDLCPNAQSS